MRLAIALTGAAVAWSAGTQAETPQRPKAAKESGPVAEQAGRLALANGVAAYGQAQGDTPNRYLFCTNRRARNATA